MAKTSKYLLECTKIGRWFLLFYSHGLFYMLSSITNLNSYLYLLLIWIFIQYQLAIFLVSSVLPSNLISNHKCPICLLHFSDRFHHCFLVNRCIALCNVYCFLSFTFYATISTFMCFFIFLNEYFYDPSISFYCLLPFGEFLCRNLTWIQSGIVMITRSTIMAAGCAGFMGLHVAKEYYYDKPPQRIYSIWAEIFKILLPAFSLIQRI